ncbi:MAG: hypothetical protein KF860_15455, partial [Cyclobacteriaceae bacterium]|nr:hypothetical protein [Cyclobacteriaceae bacterium]
MERLRPFIFVLLAMLSSLAFAQTSLDPTTNRPEHYSKFYSPKRAKAVKYKKSKVKHTAQYEFYKRVELAAKDKQRILRKLSKPQYSNPAYFGHKKKPKRRQPNKMRYCK